MKRCNWVGNDPDSKKYHDEEWGVPSFDDTHLFQMLCLEGAQAGLSWSTILKKRKNYQTVFFEFEVKKVANLDNQYLENLMNNQGIIRNRLKIFAFRQNAQAFIQTQKECGSFSNFLWEFVNHHPLDNHISSPEEIPAQSDLSHKLSKSLKSRGFSFVGPTITYAYMQAIGMINDHERDCFRYDSLCHSDSPLPNKTK